MVLTKLNQTKINVLGPVRREFEESKKEVKLKQQAHFKDETMTGNAAHEVPVFSCSFQKEFDQENAPVVIFCSKTNQGAW